MSCLCPFIGQHSETKSRVQRPTSISFRLFAAFFLQQLIYALPKTCRSKFTLALTKGTDALDPVLSSLSSFSCGHLNDTSTSSVSPSCWIPSSQLCHLILGSPSTSALIQ